MRKNTLIAISMMLGTMSHCAVAEEDKNLNEEAREKWEDSPYHLTSNLGLYSDYLFRGLSLARGRGAIQGFIDYSHVSGLFLGIAGTNAHKDAINGNTLEIDLYGGYSRVLAGDVIGTIGFLQFYYPDNEKIAGQSSNVTEVNLAIDYRYFNFKYSHSLTDWFGTNTASYGNTKVGRHTTGTGDSKGSNYVEFNYNDALPFLGLNLYLHVGHTTVKNYSVASYTDYAAGINKDFSVGDSKGWNAGVLYHATDANEDWYVTGSNRFFGYVKRIF